MTVDEALEFFKGRDRILSKLQILKDVGLGYLTLGQSTNTLSGGESQRLKLAQHIGQTREGRNLFIFDEPTTGLHMADVDLLLKTFQKLLAQGHSLIVIEHNLDLIRCADYIVDLGPEGGEEGGRIVVEGDLEKVMASKQSYTGQFLKQRIDEINLKLKEVQMMKVNEIKHKTFKIEFFSIFTIPILHISILRFSV